MVILGVLLNILLILNKSMTSESINLIAAHSKGIPRVINTICKHSLIYAASKNETLINDEIVQAVIDNELPPCAIC